MPFSSVSVEESGGRQTVIPGSCRAASFQVLVQPGAGRQEPAALRTLRKGISARRGGASGPEPPGEKANAAVPGRGGEPGRPVSVKGPRDGAGRGHLVWPGGSPGGVPPGVWLVLTVCCGADCAFSASGAAAEQCPVGNPV